MTSPAPDVIVENHGSLFLFQLVTPPAKAWVAEHVEGEAMWFCGKLVVEPRYVETLADGMTEDGMVVVLG